MKDKKTRTKTEQKRKTKKENVVEGKISINKRGIGYVMAEELKEDLEIAPDFLNTALPGDTVRANIKKLQSEKNKKQQGEVKEILKRFRERFVGKIQKEDNKFFFVPDDKRVYVNFELITKEAKDLAESTKILVEFSNWEDKNKKPKAKIIQVLGQEGKNETEMKAFVYGHGFEIDFPQDVEEESKLIKKAEDITEEDTKKRKDFRNTTTFTIDPDSAKDFDDALSVKTLKDGTFEIGIHIADVSHYVKKGSAIEKEALKRATSVYLVDRTIPMLPPALSEEVCSLNPNEDKLTISAIFKIDKNANIKDRWFGRTIIKSNKRFTYTQAQNSLDEKNGKYFKELNILNKLAEKLRKRRMNMGSVALESEEIGFELNEDGSPCSVYTKETLETNKLIEEFMLLANREIAENMEKFCKNKKNAAFIYRIHEKPAPEKIEELGVFVRALGYDFKSKNGEIKPKELNKLFEKIKGSSEEKLIKTAAIRAMSKAEYSTKNIGHFGLSFSKYTHFTSPIRRYPDLLVHQILKKKIDSLPFKNDTQAEFQNIAKHSSEKEIEAINAERDSIEYKQVEYMKERVGEEFKGVISGVVEYGLYVTEEETKAKGLVHISKLNGDFFQLDKKNYRLVGGKSKKEYVLGDEVKIKLIGANLDERELDFKIIK